MRVLTIATDLENAFLQNVLVRSCATLGLEIVILRPREWKSFASKRAVLETYLSSLDAEQLDDLFVFTDAYDAMFIRGAQHILDQYAQLGHPILFSAERNCWPLGPLGFALYGPAPPEPARYLNSGGFIGRGRDILALQRKYPTAPADAFEPLRVLASHGFDLREFTFSDQYWWTLVHLLERDLVGLDRGRRIFDCAGPSFPCMGWRDIVARTQEAERQGPDSPLRAHEQRRLRRYFQTASPAAHVHFAGTLTKPIVQTMLDAGELPPWVTDVLRADPADATVSVVDL